MFAIWAHPFASQTNITFPCLNILYLSFKESNSFAFSIPSFFKGANPYNFLKSTLPDLIASITFLGYLLKAKLFSSINLLSSN